MGKNYCRLSFDEREEISRMLFLGLSLRLISRSLNRHVSTISREVHSSKSNRYFYRAAKAQRLAHKNSKKRRLGKRKLLLNPQLAKAVQSKIRLFWSPEQIAQWLKREYVENTMHVSAETIYAYLYVLPRGELKKELIKGLRQERKRRRRRYHKSTRGVGSMPLEDMLSIEERPKEVAERSIPGHWEGDILIGGKLQQSALGTLVERTTRTTLLIPLKGKSAKEVRTAFSREIKKLPRKICLSLTYDQGREMAEHKLLTKQTKVKVYFAHPRSPWERGTNENTNGLIRQFFPKGIDFNKISRSEIKKAERLLNERPRKILNWKTPYQVMQQMLR